MTEKRTGAAPDKISLNSRVRRNIFPFVFSCGCGTLCGFITMLLSALVMYIFQFEPKYASLGALLSLGVSCLTSGWLCGAIRRRHGLKTGMQCAVIFIIICEAGSVINGTFPDSGLTSKAICAVLTACTGGVLGVNKNER